MANELPWIERVGAISVHPDMATFEDIAKMSAELYERLNKEELDETK